jgi:hypothetical protein
LLKRGVILLSACLAALPALAQDNTELLNRMKAMEERIKALEAEVQTLKGQPAATVAPASPPATAQAIPPGTPPPAAAVPVSTPPEQAGLSPVAPPPQLGGAGGAAAKALNPDISVIGDFIGYAGNPANRGGQPSLEMHESEIGMQEIIDPYARADFFFSFGEHGVDVEEGYLTFTGLPAGLQLKVGKMRAAFGKVNTLHNHVLPWIERPLVTQDLVGGEDGIDDAGLSISRILPAPKGFFMEGTAQIFRGDSEGVYQQNQRTQVSTVEHLRLYKDLTDNTNLDLGGSWSRGHSPWANAFNQLYGIDGMLRWKPLQRSIYHSFIARSELIWARQIATTGTNIFTPVNQDPVVIIPSQAPTFRRTPFGFYVSGDYQLGRRWFAGARFDHSQRICGLPTVPNSTTPCPANLLNSLITDTGGSLLLTYWPSEFSQIRGQLRRTSYGDSFTTNEFIFQFIFSMGAHGAHPF